MQSFFDLLRISAAFCFEGATFIRLWRLVKSLIRIGALIRGRAQSKHYAISCLQHKN